MNDSIAVNSTEPSNTLAVRYVGFWPRVSSYLIDSLLLSAALLVGITVALVAALGLGLHPFFAAVIVTAIALATWPYFALYWLHIGATPGQKWCGQRVVDAETLGPLQPWQAWVRVLGYGVSAWACGLGFIWAAFEPRKRGWHDLMARTVVVPADKSA